ncbi:hypothetical protein [Kangiella sp.]|uniref:hypothetical protein n=1 Tax=Kangiella sp. TaxID=1920245 RepID=UPI003A957687
MTLELYQLDNPATRFSCFRLRRVSRELIENVSIGQQVPKHIQDIKCRILFKESKPRRLGDFPDIDAMQGVAISEKFRSVFEEHLHACFDIIPIEITGYGIERHDSWEYPAENEIPTDVWENQPYWFLHPSRSFQGAGEPEEIKPYNCRDPSKINVDPDELERKLAEARARYQGALHKVRTELAGTLPPPMFVAGDAGRVCFTGEFKRICKKERLVGIHIREITNDDANQI